MNKYIERLGVLPILLLGIGLFFIGILAMGHIVNNWWPFDVSRLDLVRATALGRAEAASLLEAADKEIILAFLAVVLMTITGLTLPLAYILNRRVLRTQINPNQPTAPTFLVTLRQAMGAGIWVTFCVWLQMNRALGIAVAGLVAVVLVLFELLLQIRTRMAVVNE